MTGAAPLTRFITGASSGIGREVARAEAARGDRVAAVGRDRRALEALTDEHGDRVLPFVVDVRRPAEIEEAVARAVDDLRRLDVVHLSAGYGVFGAVEEATDAQARGIFDTNVFSLLSVLRATLPVLRAQRTGHVLQGSSYYGPVSHPGVGLLNATKYAVEGLTDALVGEVEPRGRAGPARRARGVAGDHRGRRRRARGRLTPLRPRLGVHPARIRSRAAWR